MDQKTYDTIQKIAGNSPFRKAVPPVNKTMHAQFAKETGAPGQGYFKKGPEGTSFGNWRQQNNVPEPPPVTRERKEASDIGARIVDDFIKGAQRNPRLGRVEQGSTNQEVKLASEITPLEIAKIAGALQALAEAEFTLKEASEALGLPEATIQFVLDTVG